MADDKIKVGKFGEDYTTAFLKKSGYTIVSRNFHSKYGEIDIIASKNNIIAFVEVKTRSEGSLFSPREAVDCFKQNRCIKTAQFFMLSNNTESFQPRFDVSEIIVKKDNRNKLSVCRHEYIENAF